jgi:hypothetical protein
MIELKETKSAEIHKFLLEHGDFIEYLDEYETLPKLDSFSKETLSYFNLKKYSMIGIDIYRYSKYPLKKQNYIPFVFKFLYDKTVRELLKSQKFLFQGLDEGKISKNLIPTGDGGYQLFETPLHSLLFAIYFEACLRSYNSYTFYPRLRNIIGELTLRYTITYDFVYKFNGNLYGPVVINNARILSKDKLNRFLLDSNTYQWFLQKFNGIESLKLFSIAQVSELNEFANYDKDLLKEKNIIFYDDNTKVDLFQAINISKLQTIEAKQTKFDIYNLQVQVELHYSIKEKRKKLIITVGNLNTEGINL